MDSRFGSSSQGGYSSNAGGYSSNTNGQSGGYSSNAGGYGSSGYSSNSGYQQTGSAHLHRHGMFGGSHYHTTTSYHSHPADPCNTCCTIL